MSKNILLSTVPVRADAMEKLRNAMDSSRELVLGSVPPGRYADVEVIVYSNGTLTSNEFRRMTNLKLLQSTSAGLDHIDFGSLAPAVTVCANSGPYSDPIAEHVFAMILCLAKNLIEHNQKLKNGVFEKSPLGVFLKGKTIGIIGAGGIGQAVARLAKSFGMKTLGINSSGKDTVYFDRVSTLAKLDSVLCTSDVIVVTIPLTNKTRDLLDSTKLRLLKRDCILVNVSRGAVINEKALYDLLMDNPTLKVGSDVWWRYPSAGEKFMQDYPFFNLPNFIGTPHFADGVKETEELVLDYAVENVIRYLKKQPLRGVAKREDYIGL